MGFYHLDMFKKLPSNFHFFCGNHDKRTDAHQLSSHLGDFGEWNGLFFFSGADSYDKGLRVIGRDWWPDEELTPKQCQDAIDQWATSKSDVLLSHDLPQSLAESHYLIYDKCITRTTLDEMHKIRKPRLHIYGHHHKQFRNVIDGVQFIGLKIDEVFDFETK